MSTNPYSIDTTYSPLFAGHQLAPLNPSRHLQKVSTNPYYIDTTYSPLFAGHQLAPLTPSRHLQKVSTNPYSIDTTFSPLFAGHQLAPLTPSRRLQKVSTNPYSIDTTFSPLSAAHQLAPLTPTWLGLGLPTRMLSAGGCIPALYSPAQTLEDHTSESGSSLNRRKHAGRGGWRFCPSTHWDRKCSTRRPATFKTC